MARQSLPNALIDMPSFLADSFSGYEHFQDPTTMAFNKLTFPSKNCSIPIFDKVVPDKGKTLLGQAFTENVGINGHKQKFKNLGGLEMEVREWSSANANLRDVIQIYFKNDRLLFGTLVGVFQIGETVTGGTSNATGIISSILNTVLTLTNITGDFIVGETITGDVSGATAIVISPPISLWRPITQNINPLTRGLHEYYFDEWFDTKLSNNISGSLPGKTLPRLIWVNGLPTVFSWTGGIALITAITATNIIIDPSTTWASLGFTTDGAGNAFVTVNGLSYTLAVPADLNTNSINVTSTVGVAVGDYAFSKIETDTAPIPFDMCRQNKGYMFYGNWKQRDLYMSNGFNREFDYFVSNFQALDNDLTVTPSMASPYTGTTEAVFHVVIDSVKPDINIQSFAGSGTGSDDARFDTTTYSGTAGAENFYKVLVMADYTILVPTPGAPFTIGEVVKGTTSNATGILVALFVNGPNDQMGIKLTSGQFVENELVTGQGSGVTATIIAGASGAPGAFAQSWISYFKNDLSVNITSGPLTGPIVPLFSAPNQTVTLTDGLFITFGNFFGHTVGDIWKLDIRTGGADTFSWQKNQGAITAGVAITGGLQTLSDGVQIKFENKTGHQIGDFWDITATPSVTRAWDNFYYALPVRRPGEGYKFRLPSNFWTMDTQEDSMYVNGSYGEWSLVQTILSADLLSETVSLTPLKQSGALKVIYPYMTGHINDDLVYVSVDKRLNTLGRQQFLEKPQSGYLSEVVDIDFQTSTFVGGRIKYLDKRLYVSSPENGAMHCYDTHHKYWVPPKTFPEVGILSIVGNDLICHSNVRNQSFTMFTNSAGDNGQGYEVTVRTPYTALGNRWNSKFSNQSFVEGYVTGNPKLIFTVYSGVNGCGGIFPHDVDPVMCVAPDRAPFGEGEFGSHSFGSDLDIPTNYFNEISKKFAPVMQYYFISLELSCIAKSHTWQLLSMGMNGMWSESGNNTLVAPNTLVINNP